MKNLLYMQCSATEWEEGYPIGNGRIGAMILGGIREEKLWVNEDSIWYGGPKECHNPDTLKYLDKIRQLLFEGKPKQANFLAKGAMTSMPKYINPYHPLGYLWFIFEDQEGDIEKYERFLDLDEAVTGINYTVQGNTYSREFLVSYVDQVMAIKFKVKGDKKLTFSVNLNRRPFEGTSGKVDETTIMMGGQSGPEGVKFSTVLTAQAQGGDVEVIGDCLYVKEAEEVEIYLGAQTTFRQDNPEQEALKQVRLAKLKGYDKIKADHIKDYQNIYNKNQLILDKEERVIATSELIERGKGGRDTHKLAQLFYSYGRYLLIASSREGSLPANLQGIWNASFTPAWECNYTININTQMNYWISNVGNLPECQKPLFEFVKELCYNGRKTARELYGCRGSVAHHTSNMWAQTTPGGVLAASPFWPMGLAWLSLHLSEYHKYFQDTNFLIDVCLPILEEVTRFYVDYLVESPEGYLVTGPSLSPENSYISEIGETGALCMGPTMDTQIIIQVFNEYIEASERLGVNKQWCEQLKVVLAQLAPIQVGRYGQIMEWYKDYEEVEPGHRHISHLFGLHPANQITQDETRELFEAAKVTLRRRLENGGGHTSWSMAWIINMYARLFEGELAYEKLITLMTKQTKCNLFTVHPPFQIDGNFGGSAGIAELLIQSHEGFIRILPALPKVWSEGEAKGFCARGGFVLNFKWHQGRVKEIEVNSKIEGVCRLWIPHLQDDTQITIENTAYQYEKEYIKFDVQKGGKYYIVCAIK